MSQHNDMETEELESCSSASYEALGSYCSSVDGYFDNEHCLQDNHVRHLFDSDESSSENFSGSDDEFPVSDEKKFIHNLTSWAVDEGIDREKFNKLLNILREHPCHSNLPKDARTLLRTPRNTELVTLSGGAYYHFGIEKGIQNELQRITVIPASVELLINVDGLPISKSTNSQLWPVLGSLNYTLKDASVFIIGMFHGEKKPSDPTSYLDNTICELKRICLNGIQIKDSVVTVHLKGIICDSPARAFVLNTKSHTGYYSCSKCVQEGQYLNKRICFPEVDCPVRTDEDFREMKDGHHHIGVSPLLDLPDFGCVTQVPYEYMHLVCLGVMRKMLFLWVKNKKSTQATGCLQNSGRLRPHQILEVSNHLENMKRCISIEFSRKPRSLVEIDRWKATEFRQLLLYTGPVVLKNVLESDAYYHFLTLHCAIRILIDSENKKHLIDYAHSLLICFVNGFSKLYGKEFVSYNVHGLLHLVEDVNNFGPLDRYSAFQFENYMQKIKKLIKKPEKPLAQIVRRILEKNMSKKKSPGLPLKVTKEHTNGPLLSHFLSFHQYKNVYYADYFFSIVAPDNICRVNNDIIQIQNIVKKNADIFLIGRKFIKCIDFFKQPCPSSLLGICVVDKLEERLLYWPLKKLTNKCLLFPYDTGYVVMPLSGTNY